MNDNHNDHHNHDDNDNEEAMVRCGTTKGAFALHLHRQWSPHGYDRAVELFDSGFMDGSHFFRVVPHFLVQFGITYSTDLELRKLMHATIHILDDPQLQPPHHTRIPFEPGTVSFAGSGKDSRSSQLFISYGSAPSLGTQLWETPIGKVVDGGMEHTLNHLYAGYGDMPPWGHGPDQPKMRSEGLEYMQQHFPEMDRFTTCTVEIIDIDDATNTNNIDTIDVGEGEGEGVAQDKINNHENKLQEAQVEQAPIVMEKPKENGIPMNRNSNNNIRRQQQEQAVNSSAPKLKVKAAAKSAASTKVMPDIARTRSASTSSHTDVDVQPLPMAVVAAGMILCGAVLLFFSRILCRQATKKKRPSKKVS
jgi:peptidyl-prolyl cis-trans isomerase A (cyclophilin A)